MYNSALDCFDRYISSEKNKNSLNKIDAEFFSGACSMELNHKDGESKLKKFIKDYPGNNRVKWAFFYLGKSNFKDKKYEETVKWLSKVDVFDLNMERNEELYFKRGYSYFELGNYEKAKPDLNEIKDYNNLYANDANYYFSFIAYQEKNFETAVEGFRRLIRNNKYGPNIPYFISQIYYHQAKYDSVIKIAPLLLNDTAKTVKRNEICKIIGESYFRKNRYGEAIRYLKEYGGNSQQDNYTIGYALYKNSNFNEAVIYFSNSVRGNDTIAQNAWYHLADCQLKTGEKNKARNSFYSAFKIGFDENIKEDALFNFAKLSYELSFEPFNDAILAFNQYINNYPNSIRKDEAYRYLINVYSNTKNYKEAMRSIDKMSNPDLSMKNIYQRMAWNIATNYFNVNQFDSARYYYNIVKTKGINTTFTSLALYWEGEINYKEKKYTEALNSFKDFQETPISAALPEFESSKYNIGYCYYSLKDYDKARIFFDSYLKKQNDETKMADAAARMGDCWFIKNDFANAAENYEHAIQIGKTDIEYCIYQKAVCSGRQKHYQEKINDLKSLIEKYPNSSLIKSAYLDIAESYVRENQYQNAISWYDNYLLKFPQSGMENSIKAQIAVLYSNLNEKDKALDYFIEILKRDSKSQEAQITAIPGIKSILLSQNKMEEWESIATQFNIPINKDELEEGYYNRAKEAFSGKQNCDLSISECEKYLSKFTEGLHSQEINFWMGECLFSKSEYDKALPCYLFLIKQKTNSLTENALTKASYILNKNGKFEEALPLYEELIKVATDPQLIFNSSVNAMRCAWNIKHYEKAAANSGRVLADIKSKPEQLWEARRIRSQSHYFLGRFDEAIEDFKLIAKKAESEQGAEALYFISSCYFKQGKYKEVENNTDKLMSYKYASKYWMTKGLLVMSDAYREEKKYSDAEGILNTIIDSKGDPNLILEAQQKLDEIIKIQKSETESKLNENENNSENKTEENKQTE